MPFIPSHMRMKSQQQQPDEVQVTESPSQQSPTPEVEQTVQKLEEDNYDFESEIEDLLVSILDEMVVIKKMVSQQNRTEEREVDTTSKTPTVEVEKVSTVMPTIKEQGSNALDFSECF